MDLDNILDFKLGDKVTLLQGGPIMKIVAIDVHIETDEMPKVVLTCSWSDKGSPVVYGAMFDAACMMFAETADNMADTENDPTDIPLIGGKKA